MRIWIYVVSIKYETFYFFFFKKINWFCTFYLLKCIMKFFSFFANVTQFTSIIINIYLFEYIENLEFVLIVGRALTQEERVDVQYRKRARYRQRDD